MSNDSTEASLRRLTHQLRRSCSAFLDDARGFECPFWIRQHSRMSTPHIISTAAGRASSSRRWASAENAGNEDQHQRILANIPAGRMGTPDDVA